MHSAGRGRLIVSVMVTFSTFSLGIPVTWPQQAALRGLLEVLHCGLISLASLRLGVASPSSLQPAAFQFILTSSVALILEMMR